jgi:hypothetical protein
MVSASKFSVRLVQPSSRNPILKAKGLGTLEIYRLRSEQWTSVKIGARSHQAALCADPVTPPHHAGLFYFP